MQKQITAVCAILWCALCAFAGDAAAFADIGFSKDSGTYVFGQYGMTDKTYTAYAEIYTVDIAKNDFVPNGVFKISDTTGKSGSDVYADLLKKQAPFLKKYAPVPVSPDSMLYIRDDESKRATDEIVFKDFGQTGEKALYFHVRLVPLYEGKGSGLKSSFYIVAEKKHADGTLVERKVVGNPDIKRAGVTGYAVNAIFTAPDGKGLVFVVEKTLGDASGVSIRYMVETAVF
ncbi:DUF2259 domain-containing protein [Treponema brennaborense]|uniref:DUF2259 domain-containing protein n=1 Tax=Treponema brennaborense (strain DSM 12168 / CIP 105900 / DD5/3) TaxID=906968 RepID=F4LPT5_TREBD|nr:DUF2259 domain-containing protein [Treponema brennaborense]AEE16027.1 Protein of unknown function DUF2259, secreted [Treponema brennaborense DSM 12168]